MAWDLSASNLLGVAAAVAIVAVGSFVLLARPGSAAHRLFFLLALADGASTLFFRLRLMSQPPDSLAFEANYWYYFIAFLVLLGLFGVLFPLPLASPPVTRTLVAGLVVVGVALVALHALRHDLFWVYDRASQAPQPTPLGNAIGAAFMATIALLVVRLSREMKRQTSPSHRRQAAFVLGGMALAYGAQPAVSVVRILFLRPDVFVAGRLDRILAWWSFALLLVVLVGSAWIVFRSRAPSADRRFVLGAYAGVAALALTTAAFPASAVSRLPQALALLAYPLLLGYAIARYEVFDIDAKMRRAATVSIVAGGLTLSFIVAENAVEGLLADRLALGVASQTFAGSVAAVATALLSVPVVRGSRRVAKRIIPELSVDEIHERKLEVYRHGLAGALADGLIAERESKTLRALRESLGITPDEHERVLHEVLAARGAPGPSGLDADAGALG